MTTGERIKQLRISHNMTQSELGEILGVGKATVQKYESNQIQNLKTSHIKKLCRIFEQQPHYFLFPNESFPDRLETIQYVHGEMAARISEMLFLLNDDGLKKVVDFMSDLIEIEKYKKR